MKRLSIDNDFEYQPMSNPDGVTYRVYVPSQKRHVVDLFWPGDPKRFRDSLYPNNCKITKEVLENAVNRAHDSGELDFSKLEETEVPRVNICERDFG